MSQGNDPSEPKKTASESSSQAKTNNQSGSESSSESSAAKPGPAERAPASDEQSKASDEQPKASEQQSKTSDQQSKAGDEQPKANDKPSKTSDQQPQASESPSVRPSSAGSGSGTGTGVGRTSDSATRESNRASGVSRPSSGAAGGGARAGNRPAGRGGPPEPDNRGLRLALIIAVVALVVALIALAGAGWLWQAGMTRLGQSESSVAGVKQSQQTLSQRVGSLSQQLDQIGPKLSQLSQQVSQRDEALATMRQKMAAIQKRSARLADQIQGSTRHWKLQRIESLLMAANRQAQLDEDPQAAISALQLADRRLSRLSDPSLFELRKTISQEISKLQALPNPDIEGLALQIGSAAAQIPQLPLASDIPERFTKPATAASSTKQSGGASGGEQAKQGWLDAIAAGGKRALDSVTDALSSMVTLRQSDSPPPLLLPPDRAAYLAQNLTLSLQTARQALLQGQAKLYRSSLKQAAQWLKRYFDTGDASVANMIDRLNELAATQIEREMPDISASENTLRQIIEQEQTAASEARASGSGGSGGSPSSGSGPSKAGGQGQSPANAGGQGKDNAGGQGKNNAGGQGSGQGGGQAGGAGQKKAAQPASSS